MQKHDCVVIGDSLAAIHSACELTSGSYVTLIRPVTIPVELHETPLGTFDCDLASGCDLSYYMAGEDAGGLYGILDKTKLLKESFHLWEKDSHLVEPTNRNEFLLKLSKQYPGHSEFISRFSCQIDHIHDILDEIETKTGLIPPFLIKQSVRIFSQLHPWVSSQVARLQNIKFGRFLASFNLPPDLVQLYNVMCHDSTGLGLESLDTLTGTALITRRFHGLSYPDGGWITLKDAMLKHLRNCPNCRIIGGKPVDIIRSSSGVAYEVCIDERDAHQFDWLIIDQTLGMLGFEGHYSTQARFSPLSCYSRSHVDFKMFVGWKSEPPKKFPVGVNYIYADTKFPPQAPHLVRVDCMPEDKSGESELRTKLTLRGKYPCERIVSSWGARTDSSAIQDELTRFLIDSSIPLPQGDPDYIEMVFPSDCQNPFETGIKCNAVSPDEFARNHRNVWCVNSSGINGASMRIAFRCAERIASQINQQKRLKQILHDIAVKPAKLVPGFRETLDEVKK
jgi:hypothetical protein